MHARLRPALIAARLLLTLAILGVGPVASPASVAAGSDCTTYTCYRFTVTLEGNGSGTVQSLYSDHTPQPGITCEIVLGVVTPASTCAHDFPDTFDQGFVELDLSITPAAHSQNCTDECTDEVDYVHAVFGMPYERTFTFTAHLFTLTVATSGSGAGSVVSTPSGINCGTTCVLGLGYGASILLTAVAEPGSTFKSWNGACAGQPKDCLIGILGNTAVTAAFNGPAATAGPTKQPTPPPPGPTATVPGSAAPATIGPSAGPVETTGPSTPASTTAGPTSVPVNPAVETGSGSPAVILAIIAVVLMGGGIGLAFYAMRRRGAPAP